MKLENNLPHQLNAVNAVCGVFAGIEFLSETDKNVCPHIDLSDAHLKQNIKDVQNGQYCVSDYVLPEYYRKNGINSNYLNIDVKMETGTGKTYVYTRTMFELHKHYGINKFILLVPSVPIKEGVKSFLQSSYMKSDLQSLYSGTELRLHVLDAQKQQKSKRKMFPSAIVDFANGTNIGNRRIDVLLVNSGMLTSGATMGAEYDQTLLGNFTQPYETLKFISPFVIIDEPHKFKRGDKTFKCLVDKIQPQCVIRYGATFPEISKGVMDYENVVYNLGSCDAFNENLIKGVEVEYIADEDKLKEQIKIKVLEINVVKGEPKVVRLQNEQTKVSYDFQEGQSLSEIDESLSGINVDTIAKGVITLSNGMELHTSDSIYPKVFAETYQKTMLSLALDRHFEKERDNFVNHLSKIKTLSLFFIDSIKSFRDEDGGYLRHEFETLLEAKLKSEILKTKNTGREKEYRAYLEYSLEHMSETIAAYFSEDNSTDSDEIKQEVDKVLREKDKIIRFKDDKGNFEPTRFIFSKWTLKEGWDNPNVFVIAKLRSSGSEISKLQEVGRGLRLPVDENGNRINDEQFYLRYIIDYSEKDFADRLKKEINGDADKELKIDKAFLENYAKAKHIDINNFLIDLYIKRFVNPADHSIVEENRAAFMLDYPEIFKALANGKVIEVNKKKNLQYVNVRENNFRKLEKLWNLINQKYYLHFEIVDDKTLKKAVLNILESGINGQSTVTTKIARSKKVDTDGSVDFEDVVGSSFTVKKVLPYSEFLKGIQDKTNIPIRLIHSAFVEYFNGKTISSDYFCKQAQQQFITKYRLWFIEQFKSRYSYERLNVAVNDPMKNADGTLKTSIIRGDVGVFSSDVEVLDNYLYDACCYDSDLENKNITTAIRSNIAEVEVFGKIPKRTVRIPTYADGTYSPDFMYLVRRKNGQQQLNLVVETKDKEELDPEENRKIDCAKKLFEEMQKQVDNVRYTKQLRGEQMVSIIEKLVGDIK